MEISHTLEGKKGSGRRRLFLKHCSTAVPLIFLGLSTEACLAEDAQNDVPLLSSSTHKGGGKPFAPLQALLPATRCKVWIDQAFAVASTLSTTRDNQDQYEILTKLNDVLTHRPKLFLATAKSKSLASGSIAGHTTRISSANQAENLNNRAATQNLPNQFAAILNQADVQRQWGMLRYQESQLESQDEVRAAFNYYTSQLNFSGDSYVLTASPQEKRNMIRNDALPTLSSVITSDLDLRDLYRNDLLTALEDVKAEVAYQLKQDSQSLDTKEVMDLMNRVHTTCSSWFDLIAPGDVHDALDVVLKET